MFHPLDFTFLWIIRCYKQVFNLFNQSFPSIRRVQNGGIRRFYEKISFAGTELFHRKRLMKQFYKETASENLLFPEMDKIPQRARFGNLLRDFTVFSLFTAPSP